MTIMFWLRIHFLSWILLLISLGYFLAVTVVKVETTSAPPPVNSVFRDLNHRAPIVHIQEINRGNIIGTVGTGARLVIGEEAIVPSIDRTFEIAASPFLVNIVNVQIPRDAKFVASKKGRKYYSVESNAWRSLRSELLFFRSSLEAEKLGYER